MNEVRWTDELAERLMESFELGDRLAEQEMMLDELSDSKKWSQMD